MAKLKFPDADVPAFDPATGKWNADWYDAISAIKRLGLADLADYDNTTPATNGQVPVFNTASGKFKPGAN